MSKYQILIEVDEVPSGMFSGEQTVTGKIVAASLRNGLTDDLELQGKYWKLLVDSGFSPKEIEDKVKGE
jgi:hypothetical protein